MTPVLKKRLAASAAALVTSAAGVLFVTQHEGQVNRVYLDPVGIPTACVGHTGTVTRADVGRPLSDLACKHLLRQDLKVAERAVAQCTKGAVTQEQFDALVSLAFNIGGGAYCKSTLVRLFNQGAQQCRAAADQFLRWNRAGGRILPGLVKRRAEERALFLTGCA